MEAPVARAIFDRYEALGRPSALNGEKGRALIETWLRARGLQQDRFGNYLAPSGTERWHFKEQVVRREKKHTADNGGGWYGVSSTSLISAGHNLLDEAGKVLGVLGDDKLAARATKLRATRTKAVERRKTKAEMEKSLLAAKIAATKIVSARHPARYVELAANGFRGDDAKALGAEVQVETDAMLERGEALDDGSIVSALKPPTACFFSDKVDYFWVEEVDGHRYSVYFKPTNKGTCDVHIGAPTKGGLSPLVSATTMRASMDLSGLRTEGDGYISGQIAFAGANSRGGVGNGNWRGALFMIGSHDRRQGAGSRLMKIWCRLMSGYGIQAWAALGVGDEGRAAFEAWERRGSLEIVSESGSTLVLSCKNRGRSIFESAEDPNQLKMPGFVGGRSRTSRRARVRGKGAAKR